MVSTGLGCAAGFVSSILLGRLTGFRRVTEEYDCKLRKGLFADGLVLPPHAKRKIFGVQKFARTCVNPIKFIFLESSLQDKHELSIEKVEAKCLKVDFIFISLLIFLYTYIPHFSLKMRQRVFKSHFYT